LHICQTQIDGSLAAAGASAAQVGFDKLAGTGVVYHGMELLGGGAVLAGMILGAIALILPRPAAMDIGGGDAASWALRSSAQSSPDRSQEATSPQVADNAIQYLQTLTKSAGALPSVSVSVAASIFWIWLAVPRGIFLEPRRPPEGGAAPLSYLMRLDSATSSTFCGSPRTASISVVIGEDGETDLEAIGDDLTGQTGHRFAQHADRDVAAAILAGDDREDDLRV
jgi:hypothetical protein